MYFTTTYYIILYYLPIILFNDSRDVTDKKTDKNIIYEVQCALSLRIVYENSNHSKSVWWEGSGGEGAVI